MPIESIDDKVLTAVGKVRRGMLYFTDDFRAYGTAKAFAKANLYVAVLFLKSMSALYFISV